MANEVDESARTIGNYLLGTNFSNVGGVFNHEKMEIANDIGNRTTDLVITKSVRLIEELNSTSTAYDANRLIGDRFEDPLTQQDLQDILDLFFDGEELGTNSINSDEKVANGAAVQGDNLETVSALACEFDVVPLSIGIETESPTDQTAGVMKTLINRNTPIPTRTSKYWFCTSFDNQTCARISVYEGEHPLVKHNNLLGQFILNDLPPGPRGSVKYSVSFEIDADGVLKVLAKEKTTGVESRMTISNDRNRLTKEEIDRMVADAESYRLNELDHRKRTLTKRGNRNERQSKTISQNQLLQNLKSNKRTKK